VPYIEATLFYLLDYGFLPQNVSEVGDKKIENQRREKKHR
jgi:inorganic pyrophosphatase